MHEYFLVVDSWSSQKRDFTNFIVWPHLSSFQNGAICLSFINTFHFTSNLLKKVLQGVCQILPNSLTFPWIFFGFPWLSSKTFFTLSLVFNLFNKKVNFDTFPTIFCSRSFSDFLCKFPSLQTVLILAV